MTAVLELLYKTQDTPLFILIGVGLVFILIAIIYLIYSQSKVNAYNAKQEEVVEEDISYNIFNDNKEEVIEETKEEELPRLEELVQEKEEVFDLKNVTKELESLPKERTIQLTDYEREQEETAIISYDELVTQSIPRLEISKALREEVLEEYDYEVKEDIVEEIKEEKIEEEPKEIVRSNDNYDHEESFLDGLKDLKNSLN